VAGYFHIGEQDRREVKKKNKKKKKKKKKEEAIKSRAHWTKSYAKVQPD